MNKLEAQIACCLWLHMLWNGSNVYNLIYDQTKMGHHLIACFKQRKIKIFPLKKKKKYKPRHSARLKLKTTQNLQTRLSF